MPFRVVRFQETPNPNAVKCVLDRVIAPEPRSYRHAAEAATDPLAAALFALPGVTHLLFLNEWVTVGKSADTTWKTLKPAVEQVLHAAP